MSNQNISDDTHETKLVGIINSSILKNEKRPIDIATESFMLGGIYTATKFSGLKYSYTDITLDTRRRKPLYIALENTESEFMIKTDAKGLDLIYPGILLKFINEVRRRVIGKEESNVSEFAGKLPTLAIEKLIRGITVLGGPVDYYLFDSPSLEFEYNKDDQLLYLKNAYFISPDDLAKEKMFYLTIDESDQQLMKNLNENRVDLIKKSISILQEIPSSSKVINIV